MRIHVDGGNLSWGKYVIGEIEVGYEFMDVDPDAVTITFNAEDITLEEGENFQLEATILPVYVTNKNVVWVSDNENITVDKTGLVQAGYLADGKTQTGTITATTEFGQKTAVCNVTVNPKVVEEEDKEEVNRRIEILEKLYTAANPEDYSQGTIDEAKAITEKAKEDIAKADTLGEISAINESMKSAQKNFENADITALRTVKELIDRITGENSSENFILEMIPADPETGMDVYEVDWNAEENKPVLRGNNAVAMATAYNYYLKYFAYLDFPYTLPTEPVGNSIEVSHELIIKYADIFKEVYDYDVDPSLLDKEVDKSELSARYNELKDTENVYSVNSYKAFVAALDNAKSVIDNTEATQDDVNNALTQLNSAFENLTYIKGDVTHDGKLSITDATLVQIYLKGNGENIDTETADADGNGEINVEDVSLIQKAIVDHCHVDDDGNII